MGLNIECEDNKMRNYIEYKLHELTSRLKFNSWVAVRSLETLKSELEGYDDFEFDEFIRHLKKLDFIYEPRRGYVKLKGFDRWQCIKQYCDEGKFAAPRWLAFPQFSAGTICWRMGAGEDYAMNMPRYGDEFKELFPMPRYWQLRISKSPYRPYPPIGFFWNENGKPEYPYIEGGIEVNEFITIDDIKEFRSDTFRFTSISNAVSLSKALYFEKCGKNDDLKGIEYTPDEENVWDTYRYSVLLNASYFKIMQDEELKNRLLATGDEPLVYVSDDLQNLFGRALMEVRDEIRRLYKNEDRIDWQYSEYLKFKPWWD